MKQGKKNSDPQMTKQPVTIVAPAVTKMAAYCQSFTRE